MDRRVWVVVCLGLALGACGSDNPAMPADGGAGDGGVVADGGVGGDGGGADAGACSATPLPLGCPCTGDGDCASGRCINFTCAAPVTGCLDPGMRCTVSVDCCSGRCEPDVSGVRRCQVGSGACKGLGEGCTKAADCCSLYCAGGTCSTGQLCKPIGDQCADDVECCGNLCSTTCQEIQLPATPFGPATNCRSAGETCDPSISGGGCCSRNCVFIGGTEFRCAFSANCKAEGEVCGASGECCNGVCQFCQPGGTGCTTSPTDGGTYVSRCISITSCLVAGQPCTTSAQCCSKLCADNGLGAPTCQLLGGCRPNCEICKNDSDCCAQVGPTGHVACLPADSVAGGCGSGAGYNRCAWVQGPKSPGEVCAFGGTSVVGSDGCGTLPVQQPSNKLTGCTDCCQPAIADVSRCCLYGPAPDGGACLCQGEGEACASPADCCSGICTANDAPAADGGLFTGFRCGSCVSEGVACTSNSDCCTGNCAAGEGGFACGPAICAGSPLGGPCTSSADCCAGRCLNNRCADCIPLGTSCVDAQGACCEGSCVTAGGATTCQQCKVTGAACTVNQECCSGSCVAGQCQTCAGQGGACGADGGTPCCTGLVCDNAHCASCIATGSTTPCTVPGECCSGRCSGNACVDCLADGTSCTAGSDCCSGQCVQTDGGMACGTTCKPLGGSCQTDGDCCSTHCVAGDGGGTCQACVPTRSPCTEDGDCCSNLCVGGFCNVP